MFVISGDLESLFNVICLLLAGGQDDRCPEETDQGGQGRNEEHCQLLLAENNQKEGVTLTTNTSQNVRLYRFRRKKREMVCVHVTIEEGRRKIQIHGCQNRNISLMSMFG